MNRRNFLKSLGAVCGAAAVAPVALLKAKPIDRWPKYHAQVHIRGARSGMIITGDYPDKEEFLKKFREAFKNTKFVAPITYRGVPIIYRSPLHDETIQETK